MAHGRLDSAEIQNVLKDIDLLFNTNTNYNPVAGDITGPIGGFSVQTPVSQDGKFVIQGNTLTGAITIIDTAPILWLPWSPAIQVAMG